MKHRRLAATLAVAGLVSLQVVGNAAAEPGVFTFASEKCLPFAATAPGAVPPVVWHLDRLQMNTVWKVATGKGIKVAVIDTGVAATGTPYFDATRLTTYDYLNGPSEDDEKAGGIDCTHGTHVASLIAAGRPNGKSVNPNTNFAGIAPDAEIISYRVLSTSGAKEDKERDSLEATIEAVKAATALDVNIINLSQSVFSDQRLDAYRDAIAKAVKQGIVVVAAAGNATEETDLPSYPAAFPGVIAVGISTRSDAPSGLSLPGPYVSVGAPGFDLTALNPSISRENASYTNQAYESGLDGTSYAAPIVSGVVALMLQVDPSLTPAEVKTRLEMTADPPSSAVPDSRIGYGIVNPMAALSGVGRPPTRNPDADATLPVDPLPTPEEPDMRPAVIAVSVGIGALVLASVGLVTAIAVPAATRRNKSRTPE